MKMDILGPSYGRFKFVKRIVIHGNHKKKKDEGTKLSHFCMKSCHVLIVFQFLAGHLVVPFARHVVSIFKSKLII